MENIQRVATLMGAGLTLGGVLISVNALYQMADQKSKNGSSDGTEWWNLAKGVLMAVVGGSGFIASIIGNIQF